MRFVSWLLAALVCFAFHATAEAAVKVALVIGNGAYVNANVLPNPVNDATDMVAALENLGFTVIAGTDLDFAAMGTKIGEFEDAARSADTTLFFYAGHGMQVNGRNYLLPVNAKLERESTLQFEAIDSETILGTMAGPGKTAIALLDACRDNPLSRSFSRSLGKRSTAVGQGLAAPSMTGGGILIGFATAPGETAADGEDRNSPFTTALLKYINTPGLEIQSLMTRVKSDVFESTKEVQQPWHNSSLRNEFYLVQPQAAAPQNSVSVETDWQAVKASTSIAALDAFMASYADKPLYMALAQERKDQIAQGNKTDILESLKLPETPPQAEEKTDKLKELALDLPKAGAAPTEKPRSAFRWDLQDFFDLGKTANEGNTVFALLGPPNVNLPRPLRNRGPSLTNFTLATDGIAPTLDALLASDTAITFSAEASTSCRLDYIDRCPFLPAALVSKMESAMLDKGLLMSNHDGNYFQINRLAGSEDYILSNSPAYGKGVVAVLTAIVTSDGSVKEIYGFELSRERIDVEAGNPRSNVLLTWAAVEDGDIFMSFDSTHRCTEKPRKFGFIVRFSMADHNVKWVSPFNVSDRNFILLDTVIMAANGGSCADDFAYKIFKSTGTIDARFKTPKAIERMDVNNEKLILELYEGAAAYDLN